MAFVSEAKRNLHYYNKTTEIIGPGFYQTVDLEKIRKTQFLSAPFNSSSLKRSIYDKKQILDAQSSQKIGPGYYEIQRSFVNQNVKTYANKNSVIVKFNSLGSNQFRSAVPRFKSLENIVPGPGQYQKDPRFSTVSKQMKKLSLQKRKVLKQRVQQFITDLKKQRKISYKPSIPSKSFRLQKSSTNLKEQNINQQSLLQQKPKQQLFQYPSKNPRQGKAFSWYKQQRKSIIDAKTNSTQNHVGPGKYFKSENSQNQKYQNKSYHFFRKRSKTQSSNFKSKSVRTFFDNLFYQTNSRQIAQIRNNEKYKTNHPGPGSYDLETVQKRRLQSSKYNIAYQFFGSTVERFVTQPNHLDAKLNSYSTKVIQKPKELIQKSDTIGANKSFNRREHCFMSDIERKMTFLIQNDQIPGPGQYSSDHIKSLFKHKKGKVIQNFGFSKERFQEEKQQQILQSNIPQINLKDEQFVKKKKENQSFMFKSKIAKNPFDKKPETQNLFGTYDVNQNDLGVKLAKQSMFLQNLKKIQVEVPAFSSSIPRFDYEKQKKSKSLQKNQSGNDKKFNETKKSLFVNTKTQKMREKIIQQNKEQIKKSKKSTIYNDGLNQDRFDSIHQKQRLRNPGVGEYSLRSNWTKQSYNIKYHKDYIKDHISSSNKLPIEIIQNSQDGS